MRLPETSTFGIPADGFLKSLVWMSLVGILAICASSAFALSLTGVQSRKTHTAGPATFDLPVDTTQPMSGAITVESRVIGAGHSIVFQFDGPIVSAGTLTVVDDAIMPVAGASASIDGNDIVVTLVGLPDNKRVTLTLANVNGTGLEVSASIGFLVGDVNGTRSVNSSDISSVKARSGLSTDASNYRFDLNTSGAINSSDISSVKARSGLTMPPGNAAPVVNAGADQTIILPAVAILAGTASDDGLPNPPGALTLLWSQVSGPSSVTFGDATAASTTASIAVPGTYVLRLTANDGQRSSSADLRVIANSGLSLNCPTVTTAPIGSAYSSSLVATNGTAPYTYSLASGALPPALLLAPATGAITGTPTTKGTYSFVAKVLDSASPTPQMATANCSIQVPNRAPTAVSQAVALAEDSTLAITLAGTDPDGDVLSFVIVANPTHGAITAFSAVSCSGTPSNCTRTLTYTPNADYNGPDSFAFKVNDGAADSAANAVVSVTLSPLNDAPVAAAKVYSAQANMRITIPAGSGLLAGATDPDAGDAGFVSALNVGTVGAVSPAGGAVTVNPATGAFDFDPPPGFIGNASFTYTICDNGNPLPSLCGAPATVTVAISGPVIWFVNTAAAAGSGTLLNPFNNLAAATAAMGLNTNQRIFVYAGFQTPGTSVTLQNGSWLVGQGVTGASFDVVMGITPPAGTIARPAVFGTAPTVRGTVNMNGSNVQVRGLSIQPPSSSAGLVASQPGPFTGLLVSDIPNITALNARAVNLNNVSGTFSFNTINASGADIGINLSAVNPSGGSFTLLGNGGLCSSATPTCSGGTISNSTDTAVKLTSANNVTLTRLRLANSANFGLNGNSVSVLNIDTCLFDGVHGNAIDEGALFVTNWLTSGTIANSEILGGANDNVRVINNTGTLNRLTISNSIIRDNMTVIGNHGLRFETSVPTNTGAGVAMNLSVTGTAFRNNRSNHLDTGATGLTSMDLVLTGNTFSSNPTTLAGAVNITGDHQADVTFDVNGNTSTGAQLSAFNFFQSNLTTVAASMIGKFRNNIIGTSGVGGSGSAQGNGVAFTSTGLATLTANVVGNQIRQFSNIGIGFDAGDTSPVVNATVTGNVVKEGTGFALNAIAFNMGTTAAGAVTACVDIGGPGALGNNVSGAIPVAAGTTELRVRQRNSSVVRMPGYTGSPTDVLAINAFLAGRNGAASASSSTSGAGISGGAPCAQAP